MDKKMYVISGFSDEEKALAKEFIRKAVHGFMKISLDAKIDEFWEQLERKIICASDTITLRLDIDTVGSSILTAIGVAKNEIESKNA